MTRIVFVDDEPRLLAGLRRMLWARRSGWDMVFTENGATALESMARQPADVVVTDYRMPGMDGGQLLAEVRRRFPDTIRFVLSGHTDEHDLLGIADLAHQFLTKPCGADELQRVIDRGLTDRRHLDGVGLRADLSALGTLPSDPSVLDTVEAVLTSGGNARTIAGAIEQDVALSLKVLQLVNSSFVAPGARIASLEEAVLRLGPGTIQALATEIRRVPVPAGAALAARLRQLNRHALDTARQAERRAAPAAAGDAYCAGLLHTVGALGLAACLPDLGGPGRFPDNDDETLAATTGDVTRYLLGLWGLPAEIARAAGGLEGRDDGDAAVEPLRPGAGAAVLAAHRLARPEDRIGCGCEAAAQLQVA